MATIRTASDKVLATVAAFGKVKESQFNDSTFQSVLFEGEGLPDGKLWRSMTPDQAQQFERGQSVYLVPTTNKHGKPSFDIELIATTQAPTTAPATAPAPAGGHQAPTAAIPDDQKRAIAGYITDLAALYAYCYQQASHQLAPHGAPEPAIQGAASTLFIAASRKFSL